MILGHDPDAGSDCLLLVTYYTRSRAELGALLGDFQANAGIRFKRVLVIDNGGHLDEEAGDGGEDWLRIVRGSNAFQEFSGWLEGLRLLSGGGRLTLLNDSYGRNWTISTASRPIVRAMYADARRGKIAGWLDNFSHFAPPRFSRCPNSRIVVLPLALAGTLADSLEAAIGRARKLVEEGEPLFDPHSQARLARWIESQDGRWNLADMSGRLQRIFVEHHLFDDVPRRSLSLRPRSYAGSLAYALLRRLARERR
ncbi:hypothetical protein OMP43_03060 [Sphingomonas sp. CBMAI 2297]|uniref:hypothetical protein n=1 Tax=Sphingomonas sp. CBMAI 2297 TaxID=2991720 RepID=UPI00245379DD|nr:hypothetical protein [Sphingomonas sp. CBMAI 2297]MDH4742993.1 hypothetical protein [Sphingomonas sp. CBMAI 2297]